MTHKRTVYCRNFGHRNTAVYGEVTVKLRIAVSINLGNHKIFQWEIFVYKCLNNDPPLPLIHNKDAITGPISTNLRDITLGYKPIKKKEDQYQLKQQLSQ
jgi:hypothetical protein